MAMVRNSGERTPEISGLLYRSRRREHTFIFGPLVDTNPVWLPDGSLIIFSSNRNGAFNLYQKPVNGAKDEEILLESSEDKIATSWSTTDSSCCIL